MAGIYVSHFTGDAIDVAVSAHSEVVDRETWNTLSARDADVNKIYILSDTNEMFRADGNGGWVALNTHLEFTVSEPSAGSYTPGWIYFIYSGSTVSKIFYAQDESTAIIIKNS